MTCCSVVGKINPVGTSYVCRHPLDCEHERITEVRAVETSEGVKE